jgi:hypothetical protein
MHYFLNPLLRAMLQMNDRELGLPIIRAVLLVVAGMAELLGFGIA